MKNVIKIAIPLVAVVIALLLTTMTAAEEEPIIRKLDSLKHEIDQVKLKYQWREELLEKDGSVKNGEWQEHSGTHWAAQKQLRYKMSVIIPEFIAGTPVAGTPVQLKINVYGPAEYQAILKVNGKEVRTYPDVLPGSLIHEYPEYQLAAKAKPGTRYEIELILKNRMVYPVFDYPLHNRSTGFHGAELLFSAAAENLAKANETYINLLAADKLTTPYQPSEGKPFVPERKSRTSLSSGELAKLRRLLNDKVSLLDIEALITGKADDFHASSQAMLAEMGPISEFAKKFTVHLLGNAHIDLAWLWRTGESAEIAANTFRSVLNNKEVYPNLIFAQSQAQAYQWVEESRPELFADIQQAVKDGTWDVVGGMWAEPDCNIPSGESWVRQILYAKNYFKEKFDVDVTLGWNPDSFGYNANMPQLFAKAGLKAFITQKISWNLQTRFPYHLFWWESADGSRILTYFPTGSYVETVEPEKMLDQLLNFEQASGFKDMLTLIGFGNHGGGPNLPMLERAEMLKKLPLFPVVKFTKGHDYIDMMMAKDLSDIPVWKTELYLEGHRGTLTTQSNTKRNNRELETLLQTTEKAAALAAMVGDFQIPQEKLKQSWQVLLLNQFHDILPGSSITPVYADADETYAFAKKLTGRVLKSAISSLAGSGHGEAIAVFNPLSWQRTDLVSIDLSAGDESSYQIKDAAGKVMPSVITFSSDGLDRSLEFRAEDVPALGLKYFRLSKIDPAVVPEPQDDVFTIENEFLRVTVNPETGNISSLYDKKNRREVIERGKEANVIELHENIPGFWDAWNIGYTENSWQANDVKSIRLIEDNELRKVLRIEKTFLGLSKMNVAPTEGYPSSFFTQDLILAKNSARLDVVMNVDWWEDRTLMKVAFPFAVKAKNSTFEIPYGTIERTNRKQTVWEKARYEVAVHRWADMSAGGYGVSLLNDSKYGMDVKDNVMRLSMLTSAIWPDPMADRGKHTFRYAIYPHRGDWRDADTIRQALSLNIPMKTQHAAKLGDELSLMQIDQDNILITSIKKAENGDGYIIRLQETEGRQTSALLSLSGQPFSAVEVDLMENEIGAAARSAIEQKVAIKPYVIKSYKVKRN